MKKFEKQNLKKRMLVSRFPQFKHGAFWQYLSRLNDYHAQYVFFTYEKWEIYEVILEGIIHETQATL